jgi:hypothetical protein
VIATPPLHGTAGFWNEALSIIGAIIILILIIALALEKEQNLRKKK